MNLMKDRSLSETVRRWGSAALIIGTYAMPRAASAQTPETKTPDAKGLCVNFGHQGDYDISEGGHVDLALNHLKDSGINCVRIVYNGWNNPEIEALASFAKSKEFNVIIGGDWGDLDSSQLNDYTAQVLEQAKWAEDNKIDQFSLGNEQERRLKNMTKDQWVTYVKNLATKVKETFKGKVTLEISGDDADFWASQTLGGIDALGLNLYCGEECNENYLQENIDAHGVEHVYVSETNADMSTGNYNDDAAHAEEIKGDLNVLRQKFPTTSFYFFTLEACSTPDNDRNGVKANWAPIQCNPDNPDEYNVVQPLTLDALGIK
jgi:hypothetical protein